MSSRFQQHSDLAARSHGHNFHFYKKTTLARRVQRRMGFLHIEEVAQYLNFLRENSNEVSALLKELFISITDFFRCGSVGSVGKRLDQTAVREKRRELADPRVGPGCARGEDVYSLAMLFLEELQRSEKNCKVQIFAPDIDPAALEVARNAVYPANIAAHVSYRAGAGVSVPPWVSPQPAP